MIVSNYLQDTKIQEWKDEKKVKKQKRQAETRTTTTATKIKMQKRTKKAHHQNKKMTRTTKRLCMTE